jgi:hypothetical protein
MKDLTSSILKRFKIIAKEAIVRKLDDPLYQITDDEAVSIAVCAGATPIIKPIVNSEHQHGIIATVENVNIEWDDISKKFIIYILQRDNNA